MQETYPEWFIVSVWQADEAAEPTGPEGNGVLAEVVLGEELVSVTLDASGAIVDEAAGPADAEALAAVYHAELSIQDTINLAHDEDLLGGEDFPVRGINLRSPQGPPEAEESPGTWWVVFYGAHDYVPSIDAATGEIFVPVG
ncbi:MAG: hypothetical protein ACTHXO_06600 [Actinomycetaceae bacterium]